MGSGASNHQPSSAPRQGAVLLATRGIPIVGDEAPITLDMPDKRQEQDTGPSAQHSPSVMQTISELRLRSSEQVADSQRHDVGDRQGITNVFPEATRKDTGG